MKITKALLACAVCRAMTCFSLDTHKSISIQKSTVKVVNDFFKGLSEGIGDSVSTAITCLHVSRSQALPCTSCLLATCLIRGHFRNTQKCTYLRRNCRKRDAPGKEATVQPTLESEHTRRLSLLEDRGLVGSHDICI